MLFRDQPPSKFLLGHTRVLSRTSKDDQLETNIVAACSYSALYSTARVRARPSPCRSQARARAPRSRPPLRCCARRPLEGEHARAVPENRAALRLRSAMPAAPLARTPQSLKTRRPTRDSVHQYQ